MQKLSSAERRLDWRHCERSFPHSAALNFKGNVSRFYFVPTPSTTGIFSNCNMAVVGTLVSISGSLLLTPLILFLLVILFLASIGKSIGVRRLYVKTLLALFEVRRVQFQPQMGAMVDLPHYQTHHYVFLFLDHSLSDLTSMTLQICVFRQKNYNLFLCQSISESNQCAINCKF